MRKNNFTLYLLVEQNGTSEVLDISEHARIFLPLDELVELWPISKKQADLYLFRHPEIQTRKHDKKKLVLAAPFLSYVLRSVKRKKQGNKKVR